MTLVRPKTDAFTSNSTKPAPQHHQSNDDDGDEHPLLDIFIIFCVLFFTCEIGLVVTVYIWDEKTTKKDFNLNRIEKTSKARKEQTIEEQIKMNLLIPGN